MTDQITSLDALEGMTSEEIAAATNDGRLSALLSGDLNEIAEAKADQLIAERKAAAEAKVNPDMGARVGASEPKYDEAWLATASPAEIAAATRSGKLTDLLR